MAQTSIAHGRSGTAMGKLLLGEDRYRCEQTRSSAQLSRSYTAGRSPVARGPRPLRRSLPKERRVGGVDDSVLSISAERWAYRSPRKRSVIKAAAMQQQDCSQRELRSGATR